MKKLFTLSVAILLVSCVFAQAPQKMSYQCVIRNAGGVLMANQSVGIRISILRGSPSGTLVYQETYSPNPQTNANGLVTIEIGGGVPITGTFAAIDWAAGTHYLKTETDPAGGTSYSITGTSQLLSVPYALHAKTSENGTLWNENGSNIYFNTGKVGVGTSTPPYNLSIYGTNMADISLLTSTSGQTINDGLRLGVNSSSGSSWLWNNENGKLYFGTNNLERMSILANGNVGIGDNTPEATLDVQGTVVFGSAGKIFSEIIEFTGTTGGAGTHYIQVSYPSGYTMTNSRVLSLEINATGPCWVGLGFTNGSTTAVPISYNLTNTNIAIFYPDMSQFQSKAFRMMIMKVQ